MAFSRCCVPAVFAALSLTVACDQADLGHRSDVVPEGTTQGVTPRLWTTQRTIDYGKVSREVAMAQAVWVLRNPHATRQHLLSATKPLACRRVTVAPGGDEALFPLAVEAGKAVTLAFELDPRLSGNAVGGLVTVTTDDADEPELRARFTGKVVDVYTLKPPAVDLGVLEPTGEMPNEAEVLVERGDGASFLIVDVRGCPPGLVASFQSLEEGRRWRVRLAAHRIETPGTLDARLLFVLDDGSLLDYRVLGHVPWNIGVRPAAAVYLGVVVPGGTIHQRIELHSRSPVEWSKLVATWRWHGTDLSEVEPELTTKVHDDAHADVMVTLQASLVGITQDRALHGVVSLSLPDGSRTSDVHAYGYLRTRP